MSDQHDNTAETSDQRDDADQRDASRHDGLPDGIPDPDSPPDFEDDDHVLPEEDLVYPTFEFEDGEVSQDDGFDLRRERDREEMKSWLDSLSGALTSHDLAVEGENLRATFGVAPDDVRMQFDPDEDHRGTLSVTLSFDAKVMRYEDADEHPSGSRGNRGFIPIEMLEEGRDASEFRCYNWIDDPTVETEERGDDTDGGSDGAD
jgi:hypothetical protein